MVCAGPCDGRVAAAPKRRMDKARLSLVLLSVFMGKRTVLSPVATYAAPEGCTVSYDQMTSVV